MKQIKIGNITIGDNNKAFIIGELSCNHLNNYDLAVQSIHKMKECGADCVKLQTAKPDSITLESNKADFLITGDNLWKGKTLYELYQEAHTPWEWHQPIKELVESLGMVFFSSPFDHAAVDFLEAMDVPAYKIASFEITDIPLIKHVASKQKPIIMSTGIAWEQDIEDAVNACREMGNDQIILLKCTSSYPTPLEDVNLKMIPSLRDRFDCLVGLSDHTTGSTVPQGAVALGACVIEKHFIMDRTLGGPDAAFSLEPNEFKEMIDSVRLMEKALGSEKITLTPQAQKSRVFARSLYVVEDIKKGDLFTLKNVRSIRPGHGLPPKKLPNILGKKATQDIEKGTALSENLIQ